MATYKLTYFPFKALGEPVRFLLSYTGIDFIDDRFNEDDWLKIKPSTPFGQVPVLEVDGKRVNQSTAICRYLAKNSGIAGKDDWEALEIDATVDTIHDLRAKIAAYYYEDNVTAKAEKLEVSKQIVPFYIQRLDEQVKKNGGYFVGGKLSWADLVFVALLDYLNYIAGYDIIAEAHNLKSLKEKILTEPKIAAWVAKRPDTEF
ncbi:hypothetical protein QAD02_006561 [Eretmocerus hayati]|uniref:Uncharacterized protein n=1 Tax=Eretmocerus hayati TaxID=131215 RepID=A0ACC2N177_9HYME|nr:hypothetical protein QAD02_006561 [Eretmocerus hayati]